jgi:hypothetical protein
MLRLGAAIRRPGDERRPLQWEVSAALAWPRDRRPRGEAGRARRAARRVALVERVAELWRSRARLSGEAPDPQEEALRRLRAAELDAEIEALTGEPGSDEKSNDFSELAP